MAEVTRKGDLIEIGSRVRVERGPPLITAVATEELLSNAVTAAQYHVGGKDSRGKTIVLGEEMSYLDWGGGGREGERVFYVYELTDLDDADRERLNTTLTELWVERGTRPTEAEAIDFGQSIAGEG